MSRSALAAGLRQLRRQMAAPQYREQSDEQLLSAFIETRDDDAFTVLVHRHGPMVLHVCRRVLGHEQDAEDVFQAAFLVLARKANSLRNKASVAGFLHGTTYRLAMKSKQSAARRRKHEVTVQVRTTAEPADELSWREVRTLLDEEIARLPEIYRSVFVLCHLENLSRAEAAQRLGLKECTAVKRLAEARKRLGQRLARRGVELTAVLAAATVATGSVSALPALLMVKTTESALSGVVSSSVAKLAEGAMAAAIVSKSKIVTAVLLAASLLGGAGVWLSAKPQALREPPIGEPAALAAGLSSPRAPKPDTAKTVEIQGRVLDPEGKPKAGAKLLLLGDGDKLQELGVTAADGRFTVAIPKVPKQRRALYYVIAQSDGAGIDFIECSKNDPQKPVELRLVKDEAIRGRIVNTEGKPIAGVRVSVHDVNVYPQNSLESFLIRWQKRAADYVLPEGEKYLFFPATALLTSTTDAEGRFAISGVGVERVAELHLRGAGIANAALWIVNRAGFDAKPYNRPADDAYRSAPKMMNPPSVGMALRGPNVSFVAEPEKPICGIVKDADSGKVLPNVVVHVAHKGGIPPSPLVEARTDAQGRYELRGAGKTKTYRISIVRDVTSGYLSTQVDAADTVGYAALTVELRLKKGVIVTGKILDKATGKSVPGFAQIEVLVNNPCVRDYPPFGYGIARREDTAADGTFRVVAIPGPVLLMGGYYPPSTEKFDYIEFSRYRSPIADPKYPQYFSKLPMRGGEGFGYNAYPRGIGLLQGNSCKVLDIKPGTAVVHQDLVLERASILEVKIQDAEGRPVSGVWATDFASHPYIGPLEIEESTCPVYGLEGRKPRMLIFYEPKRKIIGSRKLQGDEKPPLTVQLGPMASLKGRLLDADGKALVGVAVKLLYREGEANKLHRLTHDAKQNGITDEQGAFAIGELIPELKFDLSFQRGKQRLDRETKPAEAAIQVPSGECRDLGAMKLKPRSDKPGQ